MKRYFTLLTIFFFTLIGFSAKSQVKSYLGLYGGFSLPQGDFAQSTYSNYSAGFAKKGVTIGLDAAVYVHKNLAVGVTLSFQDQGELTTNDAHNLATGYTSAFSADQVNVTAVNRYHNLNLLAGPQYSFEYHSFILDLRASAGIIKSFTTPNITTILVGGTSSADVLTQNSSGATAFGYGANIGLRYKLGDSWCVSLRAAYVDSPGLKVSNDYIPNTGRLVNKQPISEIQTTLGITLNL